MRARHSEECRRRIEQSTVDPSEAFDKEAVNDTEAVNDRAALTTQHLTTQLNLRPRKPDLTVMRQPKILSHRLEQWTVCRV